MNYEVEAREILRKLVEIPSHGKEVVGRENKVVDWVRDWLQDNCPQYEITQFDELSVPHLLCSASETPQVLLVCHADTMPPSRPEHTTMTIDGDKVSGLGTKDMKGGLVASLLALKYAQNPQNIALLIYGDEEYTQKGIKEFAQLANGGKWKFAPEVIISPESRFNLVHSARGIVVMNVVAHGQRAHSSRPHQGIDAVKLFYQAFAQFEQEIGIETKLGKTTTTIAHIQGGIADGEQIIAQAGMVPDIVRAQIAIRNSDLTRRGDDFAQILRNFADDLGLKLEIKIVIDHATRQTSAEVVAQLSQTAIQVLGKEIELGDPALAGYNDAAILGEALHAPVVNFGPYGEGNHMAHEWVSLDSITKTTEVFIGWSK